MSTTQEKTCKKRKEIIQALFICFLKKSSDLIYTFPVSVFYHSAFIKSHEHIDS